MMKFGWLTILWAATTTKLVVQSFVFQVPQKSSVNSLSPWTALPTYQSRRSVSSVLLFSTKKTKNHREYTVVGEQDDDEEEEDLLEDEKEQQDDSIFADNEDDELVQDDDDDDEVEEQDIVCQQQKLEFAALSPNPMATNTVLQVQVGDLALARKAWKKRRRSGSPLLIPCSVLEVDRSSMLRDNLLYLLYKYGTAQKDGIVISLKELKQRYKSHLQGSLFNHAKALGYDSKRDMVQALFQGKAIQDTYGVRIFMEPNNNDNDSHHDNNENDNENDNDNGLYLKSPISKFKAIQMAHRTILLQVASVNDNDNETSHSHDIMKHTGFIRVKSEKQYPDGARMYKSLPLSAALRVSQTDDVDSGNIQQGSIYPAVLFDFDPQADGGLPLLTLSLNPGRRPTARKATTSTVQFGGVGKMNAFTATTKRQGTANAKYIPIRNPRHMIEDLHVGEGPYDAKVIRLTKDHAVVDLGVGRTFARGNNDNNNSDSSQDKEGEHLFIGAPKFVKVYGTLRFKDAIYPDSSTYRAEYNDNPKRRKMQQEQNNKKDDDIFDSMEELLNKVEGGLDQLDDGEESEDITHLFDLNEDGSLSYRNPETGETEIISNTDENEDGTRQEEEEDDDDDDNDDSDDKEKKDGPVIFRLPLKRDPGTIRLRVGDRVPVYILSVAKQSSQFLVTTDQAAVRGKKAKDIKKENDVTKKLERLSQMLGGLHKAEELRGRELNGTVKAASKTGDWLYVQPSNSEDDEIQLPVGVATIGEEIMVTNFAQGDQVRIKLDGIDEYRGQLAMRVIEKLSP